LADRLDDLMWFPPSIAPFVAIPNAGVTPDLESAHRQGLADRAYFVGTCPDSMPDGWQIAAHFLHVSESNTGARRLYESMGFTVRTSLLMCEVERMSAHRSQLDSQ
jgi:hypothetical protein